MVDVAVVEVAENDPKNALTDDEMRAKSDVVVASAATTSSNVLSAVNVFAVYVFGIVVDACTNAIADVVENAAPWFCER
jgi:F0F1-type ATP synthase assembly protein I